MKAIRFSVIVSVAAAGAMLAGAGPSSREAAPIDAVMAAVESALAERRYDDAESHLRAVLRDEPDHARAAGQLRGIYERGGRRLEPDEPQIRETLEELGHGFRRLETDHFVVLSDCDASWTRVKSALLERVYDEYHRVMRRMALEPVPPRAKMLCVLIDDHERYMSFARAQDGIEAPWIAGYYASLSNRVVFYNDATGPSFREAGALLEEYEGTIREVRSASRRAVREGRPEEAARLEQRARELREHVRAERTRLDEEAAAASVSKTVHEAVHLVAFNCGLQRRSHQFPFWLTEGLATSFETDDTRLAFGPDRPVDRREREFRAAMDAGRLLPVGLLVQHNAVPGGEPGTADAMYAQAYALFRFLYRYERADLAGLFRDIAAEPAGLIDPRRHLELFVARFGDPDRLERRWLRHEQQRRIHAGSAVASRRD